MTSAASPASEGNGRKAQMLKERGNSFYVRHQFAQAIEWYTKAIEENPLAFDVYTNRASTYAALKMWEEGLSDAREAVRIQPDWVKGHWRAGVCLVQLKQYQEAAKCFEEALKINPKSDQILSELKSVRDHLKAMPTSAEEAKRQGNQCFREGKFEQAIQLYKESLVLVKDEDNKDLEATLLINSAECYRQLGEYDKVMEQCTLAVAANPSQRNTRVKAHLRRGLACEKLERFQEAKEDFKLVIELDPTNHIASSALIRCAKSIQIRR